MWTGGTVTRPGTLDVTDCWARTEFSDQTTMTLRRDGDGTWYLKLSNPGWQLPFPHRYALESLVDFYPRLGVVGETRDTTELEVSDLRKFLLLEQIENGHTITLTSDGFRAKYDLEGSAKIIERLRKCAAG